jgi:hypothetical protein
MTSDLVAVILHLMTSDIGLLLIGNIVKKVQSIQFLPTPTRTLRRYVVASKTSVRYPAEECSWYMDAANRWYDHVYDFRVLDF